MVSGMQGPRALPVFLQKLNQGTQQAEHLPPVTTFTLTELPLSSTTLHWISQSFSLVLSLVEQETSSDFLSPREAEGNERSGQKGQRAPQPSFCIWAITPSTKHGILPWNFSCPGMGTASAGIPRPTAERKGGSSTLDLFPS